ncbi:hypothetical protein NHH73_15350 [Oxalobacteraceae bacterium OTU3CINTB1]|nr:hypothetical protein NHH73_15350 [Oxalobacteraceae bacterium OTU3CINTB1]
MPNITFQAWIGHSPSDSGHMVMVEHDPNGSIASDTCYEFEGPPGVKESAAVFPNAAGPYDVGTVVKYINSDTNTEATARTVKLKATVRSSLDNMKYQLQKKREGITRFTHWRMLTVFISDDEHEQLRAQIAIRMAVGVYCFAREAKATSPIFPENTKGIGRFPFLTELIFATRCMTPLEDLALMRRICLPTGSAEYVMRAFHYFNRDGSSTLSEKLKI